MNMEMALVAAICLLVGFLVGFLAGGRRAETNRWVRPTPMSGGHGETTLPPAPRAQETSSPENLSPEILTEARTLLVQGHKISAIKLVREATGMGLKESKELVESWAR